MKTVLITQRLVQESRYQEERDALDVRWNLFLEKAGLIGIPVPSGIDLDQLISAVNNISGLVISGGGDLGALSNDPSEKARDALESSLCDRMFKLRLPVLGVCRGMQMLAYRDGFSLCKSDGHVGTRHVLKVALESKWFAGHDGQGVNSYHNYSIYGTGTGLKPAGYATDGVIEAIESPNQRIAGIMWHPEREQSYSTADVDLFRSFFE